MTIEVFRLMEEHQRIDEELRLEVGRRRPDPFRTMHLKKLKLRIKDRLNGLTSGRRRAAQ